MKNLLLYILWPAIAGLVFAGVVLTGMHYLPSGIMLTSPAPTKLPGPGMVMENVGRAPDNISYRDAIARISPAVVSIKYDTTVPTGRFVELPGGRRVYEANSDNTQGSGVIISADGYIITSLHIFTGRDVMFESEMSATLSDGRIIPIRPVAVDMKNDLLLMKVSETSLPFARLQRTTPLAPGDVVLALGNPRNLGRSASFGIVSALPRTDDSYLIQTDAAINPGNSGGALVDAAGNLVGITSTIVSESGGFEGIGFATPARLAINLMDSFLESAPRGYLGVDSFSLVQIRAMEIRITGIRVDGIVPGSAAEAAEIKANDIITAVNDYKVEASDEGRGFVNAISAFEVGEKVIVKVFRNGEFLELEAIIGAERPFLELNNDTVNQAVPSP